MNLYRVVAALFFISIPTGVIAGVPDSYRGLIHPPAPTDCKEISGGIAGRDKDGKDLALAHVACAGQQMIWLDRFVRRDGKRAVWRVEDVVLIPAMTKKQSFFFIADCEYKPDSSPAVSAIAIGTWVDRPVGGYVKGISNAWALNPTKMKIERVAPSKVSCEVTEDRD